MSELISVNQIDFSSENLPKIFDSQRKNLKQDIIFLKEDILKDFREIENKLNTKYEKQNSNTLTKLHKFEISIESMKNKIYELSTLISTDKNIKQKVLNLQEFKTKVTDKLMNQDILIKTNENVIKEAINKYDKILNESILYTGVIGNNGRFQNFHHLIDYLLLNTSQFVNFKDKNMIDFKSYKNKLESLFKSLKVQADSIVSTNNKYTNKKIIESEKRFKELMNIQEAKIYDLKLESNNFIKNMENKFELFNKDIRDIINLKTEKFGKLDEELDLIKGFNKGVTMKFENNEEEINKIKNKLKLLDTLNDNIASSKKELNKRGSNIMDFPKTKIKSIIDKNNITSLHNTINNPNRFRRSTIAKSIVKQYIEGEIAAHEFDDPLKRQRSTLINENEVMDLINYNITSKNYINSINSNYSNRNNNNYSLDNISKAKRMTLAPDKFQNMYKLDKNLLNKFVERNSVNLDKSVRSNNSISEEKSEEDIDYLNSFREHHKDKDKDKENNKENNNDDSKEKKYSLYKDEGNKIDDGNDLINKEKSKDGNKIYFLKYNDKNKTINNAIQTDIINLKKKEYFKPNIINYQNKTTKSSFRAISYEKIMPKKINNLKQYKINNRRQISARGNLHQIGSVGELINNNDLNSKNNKLNKTSILFYNTKNKNIFYNNFKKINTRNKLNIIQVNFDEPKESINEENELKNVIKKIRENRVNLFSERNYKPLENNKKCFFSDSDIGHENYTINGIPLGYNSNNCCFYNKMINDELQNYSSSFRYLNYMKNNNKKILNMRKMNFLNKKGLYTNLID